MDFTNRNPQNDTPGRVQPNGIGRPLSPNSRRPVISDFAPRPHAPQQPSASRPNKPPATQQPIPNTQQASTPASSTKDTETLPTIDLEETTNAPLEANRNVEKVPKEPSRTGHSGLVGFGLFVLLSSLVLSPFLPGKIAQGFPGSSQSSSSGEQAIGCASTIAALHTTTSYDYKQGFPVVYRYATTSTMQATCDGKGQSATGARTSQFNPLGAVIDVAAAAITALIVAKLWRKLFSAKH